MDLDEEITSDDDWTVVIRKNKRNASYYVYMNNMYTRLSNFSMPLNPHVENKIPVQHLSQFRLRVEQCRHKALKKQRYALYKIHAP